MEDVDVTENKFMDFVILEEGRVNLLDENDWRRIIKEKSIEKIPIRDIYKSLE
jgi:hypothetical protein